MFSLQKISVSVYAVIISLNAFAGDPYRFAAGAGEAGMAYVSVMKSNLWSSFHNQAGLSFNRSYLCGVSYESRFSVKELGTRSAGVVIPAGKTSLGAVYSHFGYSDFKREMIGLSCGMFLSEKIAAGVQIDYFSERVSGEYDNVNLLTFEAGLQITASDNVRIGIHLFNPVPNSIRRVEMPSRLRVGTGVNLSRELFAGVEAEMSTVGKADIRTGFDYEAAKNFHIRGGFSTLNTSFSFGIGYKVKPAMIDFALSTHQKLGVTSSVSLIFNLKSISG